MIQVTKLDDRSIIVNADLIRYVEKTPDTMISLTSGDRLIVKESAEEIVRRVVAYARSIRTLIQ